MKLVFILALAIPLMAGCSKTGKAPADRSGKQTVRMGFMICNSREETEARFKPFCEYLSKKLDLNVVPVTIDTIDFEQAVREKKVDFTHTNSLLYVILNKNYGVEIFAGDVNGKYGSKSAGGIIVRNDSPVKKIS
ncbi:MAG TPA: PhnD/SsuA/transferrin family substrate-binding protein, partial [Nitrospirota bacterium]